MTTATLRRHKLARQADKGWDFFEKFSMFLAILTIPAALLWIILPGLYHMFSNIIHALP